MARSIFITGTDTGIGKTYFTSGLIRSLRARSVDVVGFKPIECGGRDDSKELLDASGGKHSLDEINPLWFEKPVAPLAASDAIDLYQVRSAHESLLNRHELVIVEGAGGWLVPVTPGYTMGDLAAELCDEVIIVAANRLGVLNHAMLTFRAVLSMETLSCARIILNHIPTAEDDCTLYNEKLYTVQSPEDQSLSSNAESLQKCVPPDIKVIPLRSESDFDEIAKEILL